MSIPAVQNPEPKVGGRDTLAPWPLAVAILGLAALLVAYPPVHLARKDARNASHPGQETDAAFDAAAFTRRFWQEQLLPATATAAAAESLIPLVSENPSAAAKAKALRVGLGNAAYYFVKGRGTVMAVERSRLLVGTTGGLLALRTGPVFGNGIRDGCGLLEVNKVPGLAEYNAISAELNRLVESEVQPGLRGAVVGATVEFAGCAEAPELVAPGAPVLTLIPVKARLLP